MVSDILWKGIRIWLLLTVRASTEGTSSISLPHVFGRGVRDSIYQDLFAALCIYYLSSSLLYPEVLQPFSRDERTLPGHANMYFTCISDRDSGDPQTGRPFRYRY
ncbi:hypothetical protein GQ43DRAFT_7181 [Delitschia confertaspora ATCC 74209]|uniref:Uncharacterized protein n=1 Tax=Delitschia confertaspora ATCC 74209 TaxID=1513339 RepID=A0A9P4MWI2_9PLEO|nr:hypothetical protein GQ43DRAFT_7181 [Delitschia confertaspora ATCC 74209]